MPIVPVSPEKLQYEYRVLHIDNYLLFYATEKNKVEIHRVIYAHRDILPVIA